MVRITKLDGFWFGIREDKTPLPNGWQYVESENDWLFCKDSTGNLFFTDGKLKARPAGIADIAKEEETGGKLKAGQVYDATEICGGPAIDIQ